MNDVDDTRAVPHTAFAGAWRLERLKDLTLGQDLAEALGLPRRTELEAFLARIEPAAREGVATALRAAQSDGGRCGRRFRLVDAPAGGSWARLEVRACEDALEGVLTDLPGEAERLNLWREAEQRFQLAFDQTPGTAVQGYDRQRRVIYWNPASESLYGWSREQALGRQLEDLIIPPAMREDVIRLHEAWVSEGDAIPAGELSLQRRDGSTVPVFSSHVLLRNGWGSPEMYCIDVDLRQQRDALREAHERERQLQMLSRTSHAGWWEWELDSDCLHWSAEIGRWFGVAAGSARCAELAQRLDAEVLERLRAAAARARGSSGAAALAQDLELCLPVRGRECHFLLHVEPQSVPSAPSGEQPARVVGTLLDITESKEAASRIDRLARFDAVTGLPNRLLMRERLDEALARLDGRGGLVVGCIGLDRFRLVNESYGSAAGDQLLQACARRLQQRLRGHDLVVRLGADQFGVLLDAVQTEADAVALADKLLAVFAAPFTVAGQELFLSASLGLAQYPQDGSQSETLLQNAETALHRAKEQGRGHHQFFRAEMNQRSLEKMRLLGGLRKALAAAEFSLHLQPQRWLADRSLRGAEALLRWQSASVGSVPPDRFIPLAEESGLIEPIGDWVLARCCETLRAWQDAGQGGLVLSANLSARQFRARDLVARVRAHIEGCGIDPRRLELEVTESVLLDPDGHNRELLFGLKDLGLTLAIDDFGTGYSSLSYLRRFPVDVLKIDRSFVGDLGRDADANALVRAIASMARALKLTVVAEGIETPEQAAHLGALELELGQGWLFGRPQPIERFAEQQFGDGAQAAA